MHRVAGLPHAQRQAVRLHSVAAHVVALSFVATSASAQTIATAPIPPSDIARLESRMPQRINGFALTAHEHVRGSATDVIYRYRDSSVANVSVIMYPVEYSGNEFTGSAGDRVDHEGSLFAQVLPIQQSRGMLESFRLLSQQRDSIASGRSWIPGHTTIATTVRRGETSYELQFLHVIQGDYVKVRISVPEQPWPRRDLAAFDSVLVTTLAAP
jgi:hypothetical protein